MIALLPLLTLHAASIVVAPGPDEGCPSARQVEAALAHRPGGHADADSGLTLVLPPPGTPMEPSFSLVDDQGRLKLFRSLAKPGGARPRVCAALADTIAIIVQRYLEEIEVPPLPPPPPPSPPKVSPPQPALPPMLPAPERRNTGRGWDVGLMGALRGAGHRPGLSDLDGELLVGRTFAFAGQAFEILLAGGMAGGATRHWQGGDGTLWRFPASVAVVWRHRLGRTEWQLGPVFLADFLNMRASADDGRFRSAWGMASAGGLQAALHIQAGQHVFFRLAGEAAAAAVRFEYLAPATANGTVLSTPAFFGDLRIALGMSFR